VVKHFRDVYLTDLTTQQIEDYILILAKEVSIYTARKDLANLYRAFNMAARDKYLIKNPCVGIKRFKFPERSPLFYSEDE
jgi:hypothetical protein